MFLYQIFIKKNQIRIGVVLNIFMGNCCYLLYYYGEFFAIFIHTAFVYFAGLDARCLLLIYRCLTKCVPDINVVIEKSIACNNFLRRGNNNVK